MDFDIVSNCSDYSNQSDEIRSNVSSLSGLSTYQDEFVELRHLVNPIKYPSPTFARSSTPKQDSGCELPYDHRISNLSCQLENSLKLNEKYKNDLYNLEKNIELKYYEKIEKLLKTNNRLKSELDNANAQIERLIRNFSAKSESDTSSVLDKNFIQLEQKCHELNLQNSTLQYQLLQSKYQEKEYELLNKQLKVELNELKIDFEAKKVCIKEFKEKVSQQHVKIEILLKNNLMSSQSLDEISSELEHAKKVQKWYKEQLHLCQRDKKVLLDEVLKYKINSSQNENIEMLNIELAKWKNKYDLAQLEALKEREKLLKQLENNNCTTVSKNSQSDSHFIENNTSVINYYETSIQDLISEMTKIKEYVQEQDKSIQKISKENSELLARCITLQKTIQQKEISIEELENSKQQLNMELNLGKDRIKEKSEELTSVNKKIINLEAELAARKDEKQIIENAIKTVREQFNLFKSKYKKLEEELLNKNKQILQLQNDKQKLFMSNNWNICELEKMKEKDEVINNLKCVVNKCEQKNGNHLREIKRLENELQEKEEVIKHLQEEKHSITDKNSLEIQRYEDAFSQYKIMVTNYEKQVNDLQKLLNESEKNVRDFRDNIKILKEELNRRDLDLNAMHSKCVTLEKKLMILDKDMDLKPSLKPNKRTKQVFIENDASLVEILEQFMKVYKNRSGINNGNKVTEVVDGTAVITAVEKFIHYNHNRNVDKDLESKNQSEVTVHSLKTRNVVVKKVMKLEERIKILYKKIKDCHSVLRIISDFKQNNNEQEKIKELNVLLQVKELELKEKQKKYETNNRTLLRKVKEHMKGRNSAEKHNKYLQELYNSLSDENGCLKLTISSKEYEIENIKKQLESYISINNRLKQSVLNLEEKAVKTCDICLDYTAKTKKVEFLEKYIKQLEDEKVNVQNILISKEDIIVALKQEIQEISFKNSDFASEKEQYIIKLEELVSQKQNLENNITNLQNELEKKQLLVAQLEAALEEENKKYLESNNQNTKLKLQADEIINKMDYLSSEVKILSSTLQSKSEELKQLKDQKSKIERNWMEKDDTSQNTIVMLKNYFHEMQKDVDSINNEKYFLQRLCNDLRIALRTYLDHNKVLKDKLNSLSKERQEFNSLPNILPDFSTASKYDDAYINQLLQQHRAPLQKKPLIEIKGCLDTLRKEISTLQQQIAQKNINTL